MDLVQKRTNQTNDGRAMITLFINTHTSCVPENLQAYGIWNERLCSFQMFVIHIWNKMIYSACTPTKV